MGQEARGSGFTLGDRLRQLQAHLSRRPKRLENVYFKLVRQIQLGFLLVGLVPVLLRMFQEFALNNTPAHRFAEAVLGHGDGWGGVLCQYFAAVAGFMINLPYLAAPCMELLLVVHQYFVASDANLVPASVRINRASAMQTLGLIDSIICSKQCFMSDESLVAAYKIGGRAFYNDQYLKAS